eukprot:COSAG02_NODE_3641_length_6437_cov_237.157936_9_plen_118_part_00
MLQDAAPFRLWRSQLPLHNSFYSSKAPEYGVHRPPISIEELDSPTKAAAAGGVETIGSTGAALPCALCGNPATKRCSGCKEVVYCVSFSMDFQMQQIYHLYTLRYRALTFRTCLVCY